MATEEYSIGYEAGYQAGWNEAVDKTPARVPLTDEELRDALRQCPHDTVENLRVRWLYAKDFALAVIAAYESKNGIGGGK